MKTKLSLLLSAFSLASMTGAMAQNSATTDPVGYITANVKGGTPASPGISYVGASLVNKIEFTGTATAGAGTSATFPASSFAASAFGLNDLLPVVQAQGAYYVEITSGPNAGVFTDIVATPSANTLTLLDPIGAQINGQSVKIRKHHTIASLFGDDTASNPLQLTPGISAASADTLEIVSPAGSKLFYYNTDETSWVAGSQLSNNRTIAPGEGLKVRRKGVAVPIVWVGHVKTGQTVIPVETGVNLVSVPRAVGATATGSVFTYGNSGLRSSGLTGSGSALNADIITTLNVVATPGGSPTASLNVFFNTDEDPAGFFAGSIPFDTNPLNEGTAIRILRKGAAFNWVVPAETISN